MKKNGLLSKALSVVADTKAGRAATKLAGAFTLAAATTNCGPIVPVDYQVQCAGYYEPVDCVLGDSTRYDPYYNETTIYLKNRPVAAVPMYECTVYVAGPRDYCYGQGR